jgi:hypothetical protein
MTLPRKPKPVPDEPQKDRLTFSAWPPKVDGTGNGVRPAFIIALVVCGLLLANLVVSAFRPATAPSVLASAATYFAPKSR